jgi:hypothetical protein
MDKEAHLEMLSNGTIDGFILSVLKRKKIGEYNHFSAIINDGTL